MLSDFIIIFLCKYFFDLISKSTIDQVYETARLEEVIGEFINLKKSGANFKGLSPFSQEKLPVLWFHLLNKSGKTLVVAKEAM